MDKEATKPKQPASPGPKDKRGLNLYQKIAAITGELGAIEKGGTNKEQGYAFIEYSQVAAHLRQKLSDYGLVIVPTVVKREQEEITTSRGGKGYHVLVTFKISVVNADDPAQRMTAIWIGEATDYSDKATNKASTAAEKYYLMRVFKISDKGDDPDHESPQTATARPSPPPAAEELAAIKKLLAYLGLDPRTSGAKILAQATTSPQARKLIEQLKAKALKKKEAEEIANLAVDPEPEDDEPHVGVEDLGDPTAIDIQPPIKEPAVTDEQKKAIMAKVNDIGLTERGKVNYMRTLAGKITYKSFTAEDWRNLDASATRVLEGEDELSVSWFPADNQEAGDGSK